jgi:hypothetical protein
MIQIREGKGWKKKCFPLVGVKISAESVLDHGSAAQ